MQIIADKNTKRVLSFTPKATFHMPRSITIVNSAGVHLIHPSDWELITWRGVAPRGFTAQTCYLYTLNSDLSITELNTPPFLEEVVI